MSTLNSAKKGRGRPSIDSEAVNVRFPRAILDELDAMRGKLSRPEIVRRLVDAALRVEVTRGEDGQG